MTTKPLKVVMIRRGSKQVSNVPTENLVTFIRKKALLGSDELSGDGKSWIRVDCHYQLRKYFFKNKTGVSAEVLANKLNPADSDISLPPAGFKDDLERMAGLLKEINE